MRDDPILYEDWSIKKSAPLLGAYMKRIDISLSIIYSLFMFYLGIVLEIGTLIYTWTFITFILVIVEVLVASNSLVNKLSVIVALLVVTYVTTPANILVVQVLDIKMFFLFTGVILSLKMLLIPVFHVQNQFSQPLLTPKNENSKAFLLDQIDLLVDTDYEIASQEVQNELGKSIISSLWKYYIPPIFLMLIMGVISFYSDELILSGLLMLVALISASLLISILGLWYYKKSKIKKMKEEQLDEKQDTEEIIPVFANIKN